MFLATTVADEVAHILYDTYDGYHNYVEHVFRSNHVGKRNLLGGGNQQCSADLQLLRKRDLHITRAGRHIHNQVIEISPMNIGHQLVQCFA